MPQTHSVRVAVIGAGFSGIGAAVRLKQEGINDFVVLEKDDEIGGTWRDNTYPGCACDVPSALYSFTFAPKADWSRAYAQQPEIRQYLLDVADEFAVLEHVRTGTEVLDAAWDDDADVWRLDTTGGDVLAQVLIAGAGPWHQPLIPELPGLAEFTGAIFHSSRWDHDVDLRGRRVAVIGSGASAVQFVPEIQPHLQRLHLFQRTPHHVLPKPDLPRPAIERALYSRVPLAQRLLREALYYGFEAVGWAERRAGLMRHAGVLAAAHLRVQVRDPELRAKLTPHYALGCKRILMSNSYYPALTRENVDVIPHAVAEVRAGSVIDATGAEHEVDTIIFGTGFHITDQPIGRLVRGRDGRTLDDVWKGSPEGYLGTAVSGFPNLFLVLGPNAGNGHSSATILIEDQLRYVMGALHAMAADGLQSVDVRREAQDAWNDEIQHKLAGTVWNAGGCGSYYLDVNGRNSFMCPLSTIEFGRRLRRFDVERYDTTWSSERKEVAA